MTLYLVERFGESFNDVSSQGQLDVSLIYFAENLQRTHKLYCNSQLLGHAPSSELMQSLTEVLNDLDYANKM